MKKILQMSFWINILQIILILVIIISITYHPTADMFGFLYMSAVLTAFNSLLSALGYYFMYYHKKQYGQDETIKNLEQLNSKLREQRHDYLNHVQVVYGLMELGECEEAKKYMEPVYQDFVKVSKALRTAEPSVNALLQAKMQMAEKENIRVYIEVKTTLKHLPMEGWELCKVLSNLIDNGITALKQKLNHKHLHIDMGEEDKAYYFYIYNNGPPIPEEMRIHLFEEGVTTKKEEGHGMGLTIVKRILEGVNGTIELESDETRTCFSVRVPMKG